MGPTMATMKVDASFSVLTGNNIDALLFKAGSVIFRKGDEARDLFVDALAYRNRYGLLSEDIDPQTGTLWGNFPQTYSMAGLILTAMRLSRSWEDRYWRG